jgi:hypothetical protein
MLATQNPDPDCTRAFKTSKDPWKAKHPHAKHMPQQTARALPERSGAYPMIREDTRPADRQLQGPGRQRPSGRWPFAPSQVSRIPPECRLEVHLRHYALRQKTPGPSIIMIDLQDSQLRIESTLHSPTPFPLSPSKPPSKFRRPPIISENRRIPVLQLWPAPVSRSDTLLPRRAARGKEYRAQAKRAMSGHAVLAHAPAGATPRATAVMGGREAGRQGGREAGRQGRREGGT